MSGNYLALARKSPLLMLPSDDTIEFRSDVALVADMASGNGQAFATLFHRHQRRVYRFARQMGGSPEVAEDVTQDVFMAFMETGSRFDARQGSVATYLYGITRNILRQRLRKTASHLEVAIGLVREDAPAVVARPDPLADLERVETLHLLRRAIGMLPTHYREVIVLCELHELSYEDAARVIGCPVGTVRSRLNRARRVLAHRCRAAASAPRVAVTEPKRCLA